MKRILAVVMGLMLCVVDVNAEPEKKMEQPAVEETNGNAPELAAPSAILMEASTGQIIYEKNADEVLPPASVTKVMTLLLIFDALDAGTVKLEDEVSVSEYAASMGGSQVFLEPGEKQTVDTMIKCIAVSSANDACVSMAEFICGNEEQFVAKMNERAKGLGMDHTTFLNCNGLDADGHVTTARDIARMSRELITKYPDIHRYSTIWMDEITHTTRKGSKQFGLTNTNKLIRQYQYATGLKTGSTSKAKYCLSATAKKDGLDLIAVVMASPEPKTRFKDATSLLNYGFGICTKYEDQSLLKLEPIPVVGGKMDAVPVALEETFSYVDVTGANLSNMERKVMCTKTLKAPVKKGAEVGRVHYLLDGKEIGSVKICAKRSVKKMEFLDACRIVWHSICCVPQRKSGIV